MLFWSFGAKYWHFLHILSNARPKTNLNKVSRLFFRYVGNKTSDFSSKKKGFFAQKRPNLAQNWHFWLIWARSCRFFRCPVGGSVGGWARAGCISQDTYLLYQIIHLHCNQNMMLVYLLGSVFVRVISHCRVNNRGGMMSY